MKKKTLFSLGIAICIMICFSSIYAMDIDGWWTARMLVQQGDFVTGEWVTFPHYYKKVSYMYISNANENAYGGPVWFYLWDPLGDAYIEEMYPVIYCKNNVIVLFGPTGYDEEGNYWGDTIILRPYGPISRPSFLKGFYTLYDMEKLGTPDQFVRMGTIDMTRVEPQKVPEEITDMQSTE